MRAINTLLLIVVVIAGGYLYLRVDHLQKQVNNLKVAVAKRAEAPGGEDMARLVAGASQNIREAQAALKRGQTGKARAEMNESLRKLNEASKLAQRRSSNDQLTRAWKDVSEQVRKLWSQFSKESGK